MQPWLQQSFRPWWTDSSLLLASLAVLGLIALIYLVISLFRKQK
jgi:hypothetical protein